MLSRLHFKYIVSLSLLVLFLNGVLFRDMSVDILFLLGNFVVVLFSVFSIDYCQMSYAKLDEKKFIKRVFLFGLWWRVFAIFLYYALFYYITNTEFDVEAIDAKWYDEVARNTANSFSNGTFSFSQFLIDIRASFDDSGYIFFLSLIYFVFNSSVILARIVQALISAYSVILIYRISKSTFDEKTARLSAILTACFHPFLLYASIHVKETLMIYFLLLFIHQSIKIVDKKVNWNTIVLLVFSLIALFSFRTVLGLIAFASLLAYLMLAGKYSFGKKFFIMMVMGAIISFLTVNVIVFNEISEKAKKYAGLESEDKSTAGGRNIEAASSTQSFAKYAGGGVFLLQSFVMPYPSMVKTNMVFFDQTLQWYFVGGLLIWVFLSFYAYVGFYYAIKQFFKRASILIILVSSYTLALISSLYITSIRFNILKIALLIPFIAFGIIMFEKRTKRSFLAYSIIVCLLVLVWNYVKIAGRAPD